VTVGIAAIVQAQALIVTVSDRMLSSTNDVIQARDNAALKARQLSSDWAIMFSGNGEFFIPLAEQLALDVTALENGYSLYEFINTLESRYRYLREKRFVDWHISKLGYKTLEEFRMKGLNELGKDVFVDLVSELNNFDLGIDFIVYGYDNKKCPHIFTLVNPGVMVNHDLEQYAVIGSGVYMARAALSRKPLSPDLNTVIYRALGAKFSAETASGVGRSTTVIVANSDGKFAQLSEPTVRAVRTAWDREIIAPDPPDALQAIDKSGAVLLITRQTKLPSPNDPQSSSGETEIE
jgi:hypothetical protein